MAVSDVFLDGEGKNNSEEMIGISDDNLKFELYLSIVG